MQGDVVGLLDNSGALVVEYKYDAWGKPIATTGSMAATLGTRNPFRYRGYIYDEETELYYLRSRYYNPLVGRFVSVDAIAGIRGGLLSHNAYSYAYNNPVSLQDDDGLEPADVLYIFYHKEDFAKQAEFAAAVMEETYNGNVGLVPITCRSEFIDAWKQYATSNADITIIAHGSPYRIYFGGGAEENVRISDIEELAEDESTKGKINTLKIFACNCGHLDVENNIATVIANKHSVKTLYAMDGNVSYGTPVLGRFKIGGYYPRLSVVQEGFKKYARIIRQSVSVLPPERRAPIGLYRVK